MKTFKKVTLFLLVALVLSASAAAFADDAACVVALEKTRLENRNGNTTLYTEFRNTGKTASVDRVDFACVFLDVYGEFPEGSLTIHKCFDSEFFTAPIAPGKISDLGHGTYWSFYNSDGAVRAYVVITRYHLTDGTSVRTVDLDSVTTLEEFKALPGVVEAVRTK